MRRYQWVWGVLTALFAVPATAFAFLTLPLGSLLLLLIAAMLLTLGLLATFGADLGDAAPKRRPRERMLSAAVVGCLCLATAGVVHLLGGAALLVLLLVAATSPPVVSRLFRRRLARSRHRPDERPDLLDLPTSALCRQWQDTYDALRTAPTVSLQLRIVQARAHCLDELERRNPDGLNAWLASSASAASDPTRFLTGHG